LTAFLDDATTHNEDGRQAVNVRRLEESIKDWRGILFISATSYLAVAIYWLQLLWTIAGVTVASAQEKWFFGTAMSVKVVVFSIFVMIGPVAAMARGLKRQQDRLAEHSR
jgi:hypothetical protein